MVQEEWFAAGGMAEGKVCLINKEFQTSLIDLKEVLLV